MIKHKESHMDHGFTKEQWDYIFAKYADRTAFFIDTFELPDHLGTVTNELYGPSCGDAPVLESEVAYEKRGDRAWKSRMVDRPKRPTRFVRVIAGPHKDKCPRCNATGFVVGKMEECDDCNGGYVKEYACVLYTAYGVHALDAQSSPREPGDIRKEMEALHEKRAGLHDMSEEYKKLQAQIVALRDKRSEADAFWAVHGLAK